jgi:hypothetical protein
MTAILFTPIGKMRESKLASNIYCECGVGLFCRPKRSRWIITVTIPFDLLLFRRLVDFRRMSHPPNDNGDVVSGTNHSDSNAIETSATTDATDDRVRDSRFSDDIPNQMTESGASEDAVAAEQLSQRNTSVLSKLTSYMRGTGSEPADNDSPRGRKDSDATLVGSLYKGSKSTVKTVHKSSKTTVKTVHKAVDRTKRTHDTKAERSRVLTKFQEGEVG